MRSKADVAGQDGEEVRARWRHSIAPRLRGVQSGMSEIAS